MKESPTTFLQENANVFAWFATNMPGINPKLMVHKLNIGPIYCLVKQKKRSFVLEQQKAIIKEVNKLVKTRYIREIMYHDQLVYVVLVKKANKKWHVCIAFIDLNKAYPKDSHPLPWIDQLVDATFSHKLLTFMDAFSVITRYEWYPKT